MNREMQSLQGKLLIIMWYIVIYAKWGGVKLLFMGAVGLRIIFLGKVS